MKITEKHQKKTFREAHTATKRVWIMVLFVFISLFLVGTVAGADWDNVFDYSNEDLKVTISNSFLLLFKTSEIGTAELKSHPSVNYVKKVGAGSQVVMWYDFDFLGLYESGLGEVEFIDMKTGKTIERNYSFVYWGETERDVYGTNCSIGKYGNGSVMEKCVRIVIGDETYETWLPYNSLDIPKGNIRIGLMTYVEIDDYVDGVWTVAGKKISKHAGWQESWIGGLVSYWKLDGTSGGVVDSHGSNDGVNAGATRGVTGKINNAFSFDGSDTVNITNASAFNVSNITINVWINATTTQVSNANIISKNQSVSSGWGIEYDGANDEIYFFLLGSKATTTTALRDNTWHMLTGVYNGTYVSIYVDGSIEDIVAEAGPMTDNVGKVTIGSLNSFVRFFNGTIDEIGIWNKPVNASMISDIYDAQKDGFVNGSYPAVTAPTITLNAPVDTFNSTSQTIVFNATITDESAVQDVSLFINGTLNGTNSSGVNGTYIFNRNLLEGGYNWSIGAIDNDSQTTNSSVRTFTIDTINPVMSVIYPNETIIFHQKNTNLTLNWSANDTNIDSCWYNWNGTNTSVTCTDNTTNINITDGTNKNLIFYVNDTFGHEVNQVVTWDYRLFFNYETYDISILEGLSATFSANFFTNGSTITLANLSYNSSENTGMINNHGGNNFTVTETIKVPSVNTNTNISFYWNITQGTMYYALDTKNQTILNFEIDNCTINGEVLYNFTIVDERTQKILTAAGNNTEAKVDMDIRGYGTTTLLEQFNKSYAQINPFAVCFNSTGGQFNIDVQIQYDATGYEVEFYHIQNATINSTSFPTNITLFDLNSTDSQLFKLIVKDSSFLAIDDALVEVYRKYIDEGIFKIVEIPRTDAKGETAAHLVIQDAIYKFIIKKYGVTIATFENVIAVCQTPLITPCAIDFNAFAETVTVPDFEEAEDFLFTLGFNSTSRVISSVFSIPSGTPSVVVIEVIKEDALGTSVCTDTLTSSSGILTCNVGANIGNSTVLAKIYKDGDLQAQGQVKLDQSPIDIYGGVLVILALFIMMTLIGAGISDNPVYTVLFLMVGVILLFALNLVASNGFIGATATILWLIVAIILILIKGGRRS